MSAASTLITEFTRLASTPPTPLPRLRTGLSLLKLVRRNIRTDPTARDRDISGFRPELVAHDQRGEAVRHFRFHAACILLGPPGWLLSAAADLLDHAQARRGRPESVTECLDNIVGREIGHYLAAAIGGDLTSADLHKALRNLLGDPTN
ncbi:MAG: hypothetical protein P8J87_00090 [Verrucomicrobiales bacterium]|nr:hypothetical protein [Verrucomicrobiales bacterium]